jgi:hypothetical protein
MRATVLLLAAVLCSASNVLAKVSECETDCDKSYKYCISSGKGSSQACRVAHEKCRKACLKKDKAAPAI